jgi:hypothetical protein
VLSIYRAKMWNDRCTIWQRITAEDLSRKYSVSCKTIRDIWKRRTWKQETVHLDFEQDSSLHQNKVHIVKSPQTAIYRNEQPKAARKIGPSRNFSWTGSVLQATEPFCMDQTPERSASADTTPRLRPLATAEVVAPVISHSVPLWTNELADYPPVHFPTTSDHASNHTALASLLTIDAADTLPRFTGGPHGPAAFFPSTAGLPVLPNGLDGTNADDPFHDDWKHW